MEMIDTCRGGVWFVAQLQLRGGTGGPWAVPEEASWHSWQTFVNYASLFYAAACRDWDMWQEERSQQQRSWCHAAEQAGIQKHRVKL